MRRLLVACAAGLSHSPPSARKRRSRRRGSGCWRSRTRTPATRTTPSVTRLPSSIISAGNPDSTTRSSAPTRSGLPSSRFPPPARNTKNLNDFDAVFLFISGEGDWSDQQKKDFVAFVKEDGKGVVGAHTGNGAFYQWEEFGEMMGGYFDNHPWGIFEGRVVVDAPDFPAMRHFAPVVYQA